MFSWLTLLIVGSIMVPILYIINKLLTLNKSFKETIYVVIFMVILFGVIWNNIHPASHNVTLKIDLLEGPPSSILPTIDNNGLLYNNHKLHHIIKGKNKGNFNVVFLGADELLNTNNLLK